MQYLIFLDTPTPHRHAFYYYRRKILDTPSPLGRGVIYGRPLSSHGSRVGDYNLVVSAAVHTTG